MSKNKLTHFAKHNHLWTIILLSLVAYILIRYWFPLTPYFDQFPLADIRAFTPSLGEGLGYAVWLCLTFGLYLLANRQVRKSDTPPSITVILFVTLLFGLPLLQTFPVNATDVYRYAIRGRVSSNYGQNPFVVPPSDFPNDPFLPLAGEWAGETSPYGPVWELIAGAITQVGQDNLLLNLLSFKALGLLTHLAITLLIWQLLKGEDASQRATRTLLWAWNPAILLMLVVDAHNDGLMLLWLLLGLWTMRRGYSTTGFLLMAMAPLTKPIGLLPLPIFFLDIWRQQPDFKSKARFIWSSAAGTLGMVWIAFLPFGSPLSLAQRLLREASSGGGFSPAIFIILIARNLGFNLSVAQVNNAGLVFFVLILLYLLWLTWRKRNPVRSTADVFVAYVLQALNFRIWYTVWPLSWLLLDTEESKESRYRLRTGIWLLLTSQISVLIYGHLRVYLLDQEHFPAHLIGVPFTFGLPFLLALKGNWLFHET